MLLYVYIILWYIIRSVILAVFLKVFYFTSSKIDFLIFTGLFNSNKFSQISPPFFFHCKRGRERKKFITYT